MKKSKRLRMHRRGSVARADLEIMVGTYDVPITGVKLTNRHGSPIFYQLLEEMADTHDKKSHDYASNDNPFGNYHFAGQVSSMFAHSPKDAGFAGRLAEKIYRIANLESKGVQPKNESVDDTERDICVITALWMADRRERRARIDSPSNHKSPPLE